MSLMETAPVSTWSFFLPSVFRAVLGEGHQAASHRCHCRGQRSEMHELLDAALRLQENGLPVELWEALLDEVPGPKRLLKGLATGELRNSPLLHGPAGHETIVRPS